MPALRTGKRRVSMAPHNPSKRPTGTAQSSALKSSSPIIWIIGFRAATGCTGTGVSSAAGCGCRVHAGARTDLGDEGRFAGRDGVPGRPRRYTDLLGDVVDGFVDRQPRALALRRIHNAQHLGRLGCTGMDMRRLDASMDAMFHEHSP